MQLIISRITHIFIFINLIALFTIPQLNNVHFDPSPSLWAQVSFAWISIILFIVICVTQKKISIPFITVPLALFGIYLCVQQFFVSLPFVGLSYTTALEMLICIFLSISVSTLATNLHLKTFTTYLCWAILIGALIQSGIGFIQYHNLFKYFGGVIFYDPNHPNTDIFGHFGQRNHYCHFLTWGTFALIYLFHSKIINKYLTFALLCWLMFSITLSASRSAFIYFGVACIISFLYFILKREQDSRNLFFAMVCATVLLFAFEYFYPLIQQLGNHKAQVVSGLARISSDTGSEAGRRLVEWKKAFLTFKQNSIFGVGLFGYAKAGIFLNSLFMSVPLNSGLFTNCHNLILQLLAETGLIGLIIAIGGIIWMVIRIIKHSSIESIILLCMAGTTLSHSMLEYPLWYLYFLGPFIMFLSIDKPLKVISRNLVIGVSILPVGILSYLIVVNSIVYNRLVDYVDTPEDLATFQSQAKYLENVVNNNQLMAYLGAFTLDNYIIVDSPYTIKTFTLDNQLKYVSKLTYFQPYPDDLIKLAKLEWSIGHKKEAEYLVSTATNAYPVYKNGFLTSLHVRKYKALYNIVNGKTTNTR